MWDDYQDELADLIIEAKTMVPNSLYFGDDPTTEARRQLEDYARKANLIAQDYYRNVRAAWAEAAGISMPDYKEAQVSSDRASGRSSAATTTPCTSVRNSPTSSTAEAKPA
ncbi:hypothetical protein BBJK_01006 [Bifidobacterium bifidum LMG 13195]|uniref:Uncharacterized protein n=1 Tax=Bifidobacterium bifidum LMG 13195 TaxID=1207542 RepID=A0A286TBH2_BIFBI|nr:hypothetical protein BBJK_01006 [Bifidobacterium bifidum LMG 13195]